LLFPLHLLNNWIMIWIRIWRTLDQANLVFILFLLPLQQVQRMKVSPILFLWVTHGKKSVNFSLLIQIQHNGLRSISLLLVAHSRRQRMGLQCSNIEVSTPLRAWRQIFTNSLLDKIVKYTNEYRVVHAKRWKDISRKDLESFFSVLFILGTLKRKDKPSNWFSENRLLENPLVKKVMSGRKFFNILRYLHCCPVQNQDHSADNYDPSYKIAEGRDYLENRYLKLFVPGQQLSLDETLIRAFGRIKFKLMIVTKAAQYGIKIYVITDAATAFVLQVVIYTGKTTYYSNPDSLQDRLVQGLNCLVKAFVGTH
jgi:hypothetical protein